MSQILHGFWKTTAVRWARKHGAVFTAHTRSRDTEVDGRPMRIATIHEVTERVPLQQELQRAKKMEGLGLLTGVCFHDFGSVPSAMVRGADLLIDQVGGETEVRMDLESTQTAAHRAAAHLTRYLPGFQQTADPSCGGLLPRPGGGAELFALSPGWWSGALPSVRANVVSARLRLPPGGLTVEL